MSKLNFKKVELSDIKTLCPYLECEKSHLADYTCGFIMMWKDVLNLEFAVYDETLFLKGTFREIQRFYLPCGKLKLDESIEIIKEYCNIREIDVEFVSIPKEKAEQFLTKYNMDYLESRDYSDYVYSADNLRTLEGKAYHQKRNHISRFKRENPEYKIHIISESNIDRVKDFYKSFVEKFPAASKSEIMERECTSYVLENYDKIGLIGVFLETNGKVIAFTLGEIKNKILFVHIEKADREINGSYTVINNEFVKYCADNFVIEWVNREDDSGDEGLRKAKLSYHPSHLAFKGKMTKRI